MPTQTHLADFNGYPIEIVEHNGQQWLTSEQVGKALGLKHPRTSINRIFNRHRDEITKAGVTEVNLTSVQGDREMTAFSPRAARTIAFFCQTETAQRFREWVLDVLEQQDQPITIIPSPSIKLLATTIGQLKDENTALKDELLEIQRYKISILEGPQTPKREAPRPLSGTEKSHILKLKQAGKGTTEIAQTIGRSRSAVRSVLREGERS